VDQKIVYTRQEDGKYIPSGELPAGTKYVKLEIAGRTGLAVPRTVTEAVKLIENAIQGGHAKAEWYAMVAVETPAGTAAAKAPKASKKAATVTAPVIDPHSSPAVADSLEAQIAHIQETRGVTRKEAAKLAKKAGKETAKAAKLAAKKAAKAAKKAKATKPAKVAKAPKAKKAAPVIDPNSSPAVVTRRARHAGDDSDLTTLYETAKAAMRDPNRAACKNGHPICLGNANPADLRRLTKYYCLPCIKGYAKGEFKS
jgi:hypothetical protein